MKDVNLIPRAILERAIVLSRARIWAVVVVMVGLAIGSAFVYMRIATSRVEQNFSTLTVEIEDKQSLADEFDRSKDERDRLGAKEKIIGKLLEKRAWCQVLYDIVGNIHDDVWLTHLSDMKDKGSEGVEAALLIKGFAISNRHLADLMTRLNGLPYIDQVELKISKSSKSEQMDVVQFELECRFVNFPRAKLT